MAHASCLASQRGIGRATSHRLQRLFAISTIAFAVLTLAGGRSFAQAAAGGGPQDQPGDNVIQVHPRHDVPFKDNSARTAPTRNASSPSGAHLTYYGGRVVGSPEIIQVLWGSGSYESHISSLNTPSMATFYTQFMSKTTMNSWLDSEYNTVAPSGTKTNQHIGPGIFQLQVTITPSTSSTTVDDTQIQAELTAQINAGHLPAPAVDSAGQPKTIYAVFFPPGITITQGGSQSCVSGGFCAYHGTVAQSGSLGEFMYGVHPDMQAGSGCFNGCGTSSVFDNYTSVASHELVETITDAEVGLAATIGPPLAWYDINNGEIGDICNAEQGTFVGCDGETYTYQLEFSNAGPNGNACITIAPSCGSTSDFSISASPTSLNLTAGGSGGSSTISTVAAGGAGTVSLAVSGTGNGVSASLSPASVAAGGSSTLSVTTTSTATPGAHVLTITGTEGTNSHATTVTVNVAAPDDFSISASPTSLNLTAGGTGGSSTVSTAVASGNAGTVSLVVSGTGNGVSASLSPTSVTAGGSSTLSVTTTSTATPGAHVLTITGTEGSSTHATTVTVNVAAPDDFSISASPTSLNLTAGGSGGSSTVSTAIASGNAGTVSLVVSGTGNGVSASLSPTSVTAGGSSTLSVTTTSTATPGAHVLTITGTEGTSTHATTVTVNVAAPADFSISASPTSLNLTAGGSGGSSTVSTAVVGSAGTVNLAVSGTGNGVSASLSPASVAAGGNSTLSVTTTSTATPGAHVLTITGTEGTNTHSTTVTVNVAAPDDFSISASPTSIGITAGGAGGSSTVSTAVASGNAGTVNLTVSGMPSGVTATLSPTSVTAGGGSTLTVSASSSAVPGTFNLTISGTEGTMTHTTIVSVTVNAPPSFSLSVSPTSLSVRKGGTATYSVTITPANGFNSGVTLSVTGLPANATATFTPNPAGTSSTLRVTTSPKSQIGNFPLTIRGVSGSLSQTATATLTVTKH